MGEQIGSVEYPVEQCELFGEQGLRVVRIDNRDTGLSGPDDNDDTPYTLHDMADDIAAVIRGLGEGPVNVLGASMGGLIARWLTIRHPDLVSTLTVVMSGCGASPTDNGPQVDPSVRERAGDIIRRLPRDAPIQKHVEFWRWLYGDQYQFPEEFVRERVSYAYDRAYRPDGLTKQLKASMTTPGLWDEQRQIQVPTLVLHGGEDPYFSTAHGEAIANQIAGAELWIDPKMGHIMHQEHWNELASRVWKLADSV